MKEIMSGRYPVNEELVISASLLKRSKTDDLVARVNQNIGDIHERSNGNGIDTSRRSAGFPVVVVNLKAHALYDHIRSIFYERLEPTDGKVHKGCVNALKQALDDYLGSLWS